MRKKTEKIKRQSETKKRGIQIEIQKANDFQLPGKIVSVVYDVEMQLLHSIATGNRSINCTENGKMWDLCIQNCLHLHIDTDFRQQSQIKIIYFRAK